MRFQTRYTVKKQDGRFTEVTLWLMHIGENYNGTVFEKSVIEAAIPSLDNIPIVGYIRINSMGDLDFAGHEEDFENGEYLGSAYGVIPDRAHNNARFEKHTDKNGVEREYLCVDGILWNQFKCAKRIMERDGEKAESIELVDFDVGDYEGEEDENGLFHFTHFSFRAACILGRDYYPAMEGANIRLNFSADKFWDSVWAKCRAEYLNYVKGSENSMTIEELREKLAEQVKAYKPDGAEVPPYIFADVDTEANKVYMFDISDSFSLCSAPLTEESSIDFGQVAEDEVFLSDAYEDVVNALLEKTAAAVQSEAELTAKVEQLNDELASKAEELAELKAAEEADLKEAEYSKYSYALAGNEEYVAMKESMADMSVSDVETKCALLYARASLAQTSKSAGRLSAGMNDDAQHESGTVYLPKYGEIPVNH